MRADKINLVFKKPLAKAYLLKILWAMTAWLFLSDVWDPHTPFFHQKHNFYATILPLSALGDV